MDRVADTIGPYQQPSPADVRLSISPDTYPDVYLDSYARRLEKNDFYSLDHLQIFGFNSQLYNNFSDALQRAQGIVAVSLLLQVGDLSNPALRIFTEELDKIRYGGQAMEIKRFVVRELLPDTKYYMTYDGSITMPACHETTTWIILNKPIYITQQQLIALRQLMQGDKGELNAPLGNNFRPPQPLHHRPVRTNIDFNVQFVLPTVTGLDPVSLATSDTSRATETPPRSQPWNHGSKPVRRSSPYFPRDTRLTKAVILIELASTLTGWLSRARSRAERGLKVVDSRPGGGAGGRGMGFIEPEFDGAARGRLCGKGAEKGQLRVTREREGGGTTTTMMGEEEGGGSDGRGVERAREGEARRTDTGIRRHRVAGLCGKSAGFVWRVCGSRDHWWETKESDIDSLTDVEKYLFRRVTSVVSSTVAPRQGQFARLKLMLRRLSADSMQQGVLILTSAIFVPVLRATCAGNKRRKSGIPRMIH
ncbi:Carbonic anhydrase-related protein 10 [Eufriesea mexicana]|uniref:Carbonic anhydrase-related protein 10 n=1 Tax=Eufriesea mexicana TaxID=516756 RepID=A0A310SG29_9HYME|nr:Carbonic anhydrase-related protein 10 [Eufriesea mexicana]